MGQIVLDGVDHRLGAVAQSGFGEDVVYVCLDCRFADRKVLGDLAIAVPGSDLAEDFGFALSQTVGITGRWWRRNGRGATIVSRLK